MGKLATAACAIALSATTATVATVKNSMKHAGFEINPVNEVALAGAHDWAHDWVHVGGT